MVVSLNSLYKAHVMKLFAVGSAGLLDCLLNYGDIEPLNGNVEHITLRIEHV